jgi:hypothetical protein
MPDSTLLHDATPGIGHNQPPEAIEPRPPLGLSLPPEALNRPAAELDEVAVLARLQVVYAPMMRRFVELEQGAARVPEEIPNEAEARRLLSFVSEQCGALKTEAKEAHDKEKRPYLECGRAVDRFFLNRIREFTVALSGVATRAEQYLRRATEEQRRLEEQQRQRAAAQQRQAEAEAARLAAEAKRVAEQDRAAAVDIGRQAEEAAAVAAQAKAVVEAAPTPVRLHGEYGSTAYFTEEWDYDVVDFTKLPLGLMMPYDAAIRRRIKEGVREIPGLRIFSRDKFHMRKC